MERLLDKEDTVIKRAKVSKKALLVTWLSIPTVLLVFYGGAYVPYLIRTIIKRQFFGEQKGLLSSLPPFLKAIITFFVVLLISVWLIWAIFVTLQHFQYEVLLTENVLIARNRKKVVKMKLNNINNVFLERSIWGRIFNYGTITFVGSQESITVKNIHDPKDFVNYVKNRL